MSTKVSQLVATIGNALAQLKDEFADPSLVSLSDVAEEMEKLEAFFNTKAYVDASFAYICERDEAGRLVGATRPNAYLQGRLGLSAGEAYDRLARGRDLFAPPPESVPVEEEDDSADSSEGADLFSGASGVESDADASAAAEAAARAEEERRRAQEDARRRASAVSAEKQNIIRRELDKLLKAARGERARIHARAMEEADRRDAKDLRYFVRRLVEDANREHAPRSNPNAGYENRGLHIGKRKADGTVDIQMNTTAGFAALIKAHADKGLSPNSNMSEDEKDYRNPAQRRHDQIISIFKGYESDQQKLTGGAASVVIPMTLDDLAGADSRETFATNTGIELDVFDLVRLGLDGLDSENGGRGPAHFLLQIDGVRGVPLSLGLTRGASIAQRIALLAVQGVCAWTGCTAPLTECEVHHIIAWVKGGSTDINNLTALCREHHRCNNDERDGSGGKGHMEYDPGTGRAGLVRSGSSRMEFNQSDPAEHSAVRRTMKRSPSERPSGAGPGRLRPDPVLFTPKPRPHGNKPRVTVRRE